MSNAVLLVEAVPRGLLSVGEDSRTAGALFAVESCPDFIEYEISHLISDFQSDQHCNCLRSMHAFIHSFI